MHNMSAADEKKLMSAVEEAVLDSRNGVSPNEALQKVAAKYDFTPPQINLITGAYNKARAVHFLKTAGDKAAEFPLADPVAIIHSLFKDASPEAKPESSFKHNVSDWSKVDYVKHVPMQKAASDENTFAKLSTQSKYNLLQKYASTVQLTRRKIEDQIAMARHNFDKALNKSASSMDRLTDSELKRVAQLVVNSYKESGSKFLKLASTRMTKDVPELEKTANAAIFPPQEPYLSITTVFDSAMKLASAQNSLALFTKEAEGMTEGLSNFLTDQATQSAIDADEPTGANVLQNWIKTQPTRAKSLEEKLDPQFYNNLKELELRRTLYDLFLYDKDLKNYDFKDLVSSYNNVIQIAPAVIDKPPILKNLILQDIESGGIKDINEIKVMGDINKAVGLEKGMKKGELAQQKMKAAMDKPVAQAGPSGRSEPGLLRTAAGNLLTQIGEKGEKIKEKREKKQEATKEGDVSANKAVALEMMKGNVNPDYYAQKNISPAELQRRLTEELAKGQAGPTVTAVDNLMEQRKNETALSNYEEIGRKALAKIPRYEVQTPAYAAYGKYMQHGSSGLTPEEFKHVNEMDQYLEDQKRGFKP